MSFDKSYLGRLRKKVGSDTVLMPGAMVVAQRPDGQVLVTRRSDNNQWCLPAGGAEIGGSFASTAVNELAEEVGLRAKVDDLVAFGSLSEADAHTIHYPNGDITHCFALLFLVRRWQGTPLADGQEAMEARFAELDKLPEPMMAPAAQALELFRSYLSNGQFQLG